MLKKIFAFTKSRWAYLLSIAFIWCIPIALLAEIVVLAKMYIGIKLTLIGYIVVCVALFVLKKKISGFINKQNKTALFVLSCFVY